MSVKVLKPRPFLVVQSSGSVGFTEQETTKPLTSFYYVGVHVIGNIDPTAKILQDLLKLKAYCARYQKTLVVVTDTLLSGLSSLLRRSLRLLLKVW